MPERDEANSRVVAKEPCPKCHSRDNLVRYADGHAHCFTPGCGHWEKGEGGEETPKRKAPAISGPLLSPSDDTAWEPLSKRRLKSETLRRYGYFRATFNRQGAQVAPYYDHRGEMVVQKIRLPDKTFPTLKADGAPPLGECQLFGQHVYGERYDRRVIITEGELDTMSVAQVLDFKTAVVSVNTGAQGAVKCLQSNYRWVDRFGEIVLWFDDDEPGRRASEECAKLFQVGKVRIAKAPGFKDASEALQANKPGDIEAAIYMAQTWRPRGIVNAADCLADIVDESARPPSWSYPWEGLQKMTLGIRPGEVVYHVAGTGIGKTTAMREIEHHLIIGEGLKIGHLGFEDMRRDVLLGLLSVHTGRRLHLDPMPKGELEAAHKEVFGTRKVELFDPETAEWSIDATLGYVRYMAKALECACIFVDPLSFIAAGLSLGDDERRALDKASRDLAALAKELGIALHVTHHLKRPEGTAHEEGAETSINQVRGSGGIANFASVVIGWERNQQADHAELIRARVLKNRPVGSTGVAMVLRYDGATGRLQETADRWPEKTRRGGFGPTPADTDFGIDY